ncbi:hypothetical protein HanXRQr2_Chr09g0411631 [Helianthus annuus]|uniref:Uncharacterized protein n=1 Tax=Helianthus annuus TaxID=4232 RepID=A0A9K3NAR4_HELAN|nr:hypothetical protein HanXRQr2_Chr09g0411631 [Helianthus annuus]KAJ0895202.1 hypothetical protein HanPSC8_Chr09g0397721 [Helianthus annuus]
MDAAIDAMKPFGLTREVVTAKKRQLLKKHLKLSMAYHDGLFGWMKIDCRRIRLCVLESLEFL